MVGFSSSSRRRGRVCGIAALSLAASTLPLPSVRAEQVLVASLVDDITYSDIVQGGDCHNGCHREEHSVAHVSGTPQTRQCELQTISPFDATVPRPGLLRASIYCEDSSGTLVEKGTRPCIFDICVDFAWNELEGDGEGELTYDVVIKRTSKPSAPHTVYVDLSVAVDPSAPNGSVDSCEAVGTCGTINCGVEYTAEIAMTDSFGDGWVGGVDGYYNLWELWALNDVGDPADDEAITRGTLADNHESATIKECLPDGTYIFNTTASSAFAEDIGWGICNNYGVAGEGLRFTVMNGACNGGSAEKIPRATAEETSDAEYSYCTLPAPSGEDDFRTTTCTALSSGMKIDGVALYYDDRCNSADYSGCGARTIPACRLCFVDKEQWRRRFPFERMPDWEDCPCCVAAHLGVECKTGGGGGGPDQGVIIGVSVGIAGVIAVACCLSCAFGPTILRFFRRMKKRKDAEDQLDLDGHVGGGTSAFPESPGGGGERGRSGTAFPIPRFDSIRGRFDSGGGGGAGGGPSGGGVVAGAHVNKVTDERSRDNTTAQTTPSASGHGSGLGGGAKAPRSTVLDDRLVAQGYTTSDLGRPVSAASSAASRNGGRTGWGLAMSGEYPDLGNADPYAGNNAMVETGTARY